MLTKFQWKVILVALCISAAALFLRFNMAVYGPIEADEPAYVDAAIQYSRDIRTGNWTELINSTLNYEHPAFFKIIYGLFMSMPKSTNPVSMAYDTQIFNSDNFIRLLGLRLVSVFFGVLSVFTLAVINPWAGVFLAVNTFSVKYTSVIYLESLPYWLSAVSVILSMKWIGIYSAPLKWTRAAPGWFFLSAAAMGLAIASKYLYGVAGLAVVIYAFCLSLTKKSFGITKMTFLWIALTGLFFILGDPLLWSDPVNNLIKSFSFNLSFSHENAVYPFWQPFVWLSLSIPQQSNMHVFQSTGNFLVSLDTFYLPFAVAGLWPLKRKYPIFALWLLLGLVFLLAWSTKWPQYVLLIMVPYCLSAALGLEWTRLKFGAFLRKSVNF